MEIGIVSLPLYTKYGGILQAYALIAVFSRMGREAFFIQKLAAVSEIYSLQVNLTVVQSFLSHTLKGQRLNSIIYEKSKES